MNASREVFEAGEVDRKAPWQETAAVEGSFVVGREGD